MSTVTTLRLLCRIDCPDGRQASVGELLTRRSTGASNQSGPLALRQTVR
jgi:hypothetical protein